MKIFNEIVDWLNTNHDLAYSIIRMFLGAALFVRGLILLSDPAAISELAGQNELYWWFSYITIIHIIAGLLLTLGLLTRIAALLQIPPFRLSKAQLWLSFFLYLPKISFKKSTKL